MHCATAYSLSFVAVCDAVAMAKTCRVRVSFQLAFAKAIHGNRPLKTITFLKIQSVSTQTNTLLRLLAAIIYVALLLSIVYVVHDVNLRHRP